LLELKLPQSLENPQKSEVQTPEIKKYKLKLGEQEEEIPEAELAELVKAGRNANLTQKEAQELKSLLQQLKENPRKMLADPKLGVDLYKLAEETLLEKIQQDMLTPEQKKLQEYEKRFKEIEEKEKSEKEKKEQETLAQAESYWADQYDKMFDEALTSSGLRKTPKTIKRMAEIAALKLERHQEFDAKLLAEAVREDYLAELKDLLGSSDEDALLTLLEDDISNKIRKADLKRLKSTPSAGSVTLVPRSKSVPKPEAKSMTAQEWRERMERIKRGLE
jgi:hypothetical protein